MICEKCYGVGVLEIWQISPGWGTHICQDCGGTGTVYCCDGLQEQPTPEDWSERPRIYPAEWLDGEEI